MWPFRKRISLKDSGIFKNFTDCHSHILPGVDDGVQTMEEALEILRLYEELGIKSVWLTPHIMEDMPNTTLHLRERYAELQATYSGPIKLHLALRTCLTTSSRNGWKRTICCPWVKAVTIYWWKPPTLTLRWD